MPYVSASFAGVVMGRPAAAQRCHIGAALQLHATLSSVLLCPHATKNGATAHPPLQAPLLRGDPAVQARVFDLLYNLSVHGELLYDAAAEAVPEDAPALAEAGEGSLGNCHPASVAVTLVG